MKHCSNSARRWAGWLCFLATSAALAGSGPETTLLVADVRSPLSLQVANTWAGLRRLPEHHVLWLETLPAGDTIDVEDFRRHVLVPLRAHMEAHGLEGEIDLVAYSAGFPYAVDFGRDEAANGLARDKLRGDAGSLTGMSFFARKVEAGRADYFGPLANHYARRPRAALPQILAGRGGTGAGAADIPPDALGLEDARGFRSRYRWGRGPGGQGMGESDRYRLAVMLGYTGLRGNSVPEIERYLARAAASDGTQPAGTVYLMKNRDIRSRTREHLFAPAIAGLQARGLRAEVLEAGRGGEDGRAPRDRPDAIGVVAGTRTFDWAASGSTLLPGAIAEALTSYGGHFAIRAQTKLSEFLRHGAAGSSGAVREPYALVEKFPLPQIHQHYADGVSLAEAFFLSVLSPYQLLVVGEPLARPFARFATIELPDWPAHAVGGQLVVQTRVRPAPGRPIERVELWVDGLPAGSAAVGESLSLDTRALADGEHEVRVVAVESGAIETRSWTGRPLRVDNRARRVTLAAPGEVGFGAPLVVGGEAEGARTVRIEQLGRVLAEVAVREGRWQATLDSARLGVGEPMLRAVGVWPDGGRARSVAVHARVGLPALSPALAVGEGRGRDAGLRLRVERAGSPPLDHRVDGLSKPLPREVGAAKAARLRFEGEFRVDADGLHQLDLETDGEAVLRVDGREIAALHHIPGPRKASTFRHALALAKGWHRLEVEVVGSRTAAVRALLAGPEPAFVLEGDRVRAAAP